MIQPHGEAYLPSIEQEYYDFEAARNPRGVVRPIIDQVDTVLYGAHDQTRRGNTCSVNNEGSLYEASYDVLYGDVSGNGYEWPLGEVEVSIRHETFRGRTAIEESYVIRVKDYVLQNGVKGSITTEYILEKLRGERTVASLMELMGISYGDWPEAESNNHWRRFRSVVEGELEPRDMCAYDMDTLRGVDVPARKRTVSRSPRKQVFTQCTFIGQ